MTTALAAPSGEATADDPAAGTECLPGAVEAIAIAASPQGGGAESSADDLGLSRGVVLSRAAASLRSVETQPHDWQICPLQTGTSAFGRGRGWVSLLFLWRQVLLRNVRFTCVFSFGFSRASWLGQHWWCWCWGCVCVHFPSLPKCCSCHGALFFFCSLFELY